LRHQQGGAVVIESGARQAEVEVPSGVARVKPFGK